VKPKQWGTKSKLALAVMGAAAVGTLALAGNSPASLSKPAAMKKAAKGSKLVEQAKSSTSSPIKVTYGDMSDDEIESIFEKFLVDFSKPYRSDKKTKASRFEVFKVITLCVCSCLYEQANNFSNTKYISSALGKPQGDRHAQCLEPNGCVFNHSTC
jgi:hypothetical protein